MRMCCFVWWHLYCERVKSCYVHLSCAGSIWGVKLHRLNNFLLYTVTDQNTVFGTWFMQNDGTKLYSYQRERNREHHGKRVERRLFLLFSSNLAGVLDFLILQSKHNICTLSVNLKLICTRWDTGQKNSPKPWFSSNGNNNT